MRAREGNLKSSRFADELDLLYPIIETGGSDSAAFDNVLELLTVNGVVTLPEAVMMLIPEAWQNNPAMEKEKVAFYQWAACLMEPWDGPALFAFSDSRFVGATFPLRVGFELIAFSDSRFVGATLDRNGLRPCRWITTTDDLMICGSEVGAIYIEPERILRKGRLQPGKMLLVDTLEGRIIDDKELKMKSASRQPFASWLENQMLRLPNIMAKERAKGVRLAIELDDYTVSTDPKLLAFGYSFEQFELLLKPIIQGSPRRSSSLTSPC